MCIIKEIQQRVWDAKVAGKWTMDLSAKKQEYHDKGLSPDIIEKLMWFHRIEGIYLAEGGETE